MRKLVSSMLLVGLIAGSVPVASSFAMFPVLDVKVSRFPTPENQMAKLTEAKERMDKWLKEYREIYVPSNGYPKNEKLDGNIEDYLRDVYSDYDEAMETLRGGKIIDVESIIKDWKLTLRRFEQWINEAYEDVKVEKIVERDKKRDLKNFKTKHNSKKPLEEREKAEAKLLVEVSGLVSWEQVKEKYYPFTYQRHGQLRRILENMPVNDSMKKRLEGLTGDERDEKELQLKMEVIKEKREREKSRGWDWQKKKYEYKKRILLKLIDSLDHIIEYLMEFKDSRAFYLANSARKLRAQIEFGLNKVEELEDLSDLEGSKPKEYVETFSKIVKAVKKYIQGVHFKTGLE